MDGFEWEALPIGRSGGGLGKGGLRGVGMQRGFEGVGMQRGVEG